MKKIISVLAVLAMVSAVFAVDISTSMRLGWNLFSVDKLGDDDAIYRIFDLENDTADSFATNNNKIKADAFSFTAGTQFGGFKYNFNPNIYKIGSADIWTGAKDANFYLQYGSFKISAGKWGDGVYFAEQAKKDHDDTNLSGNGTLAGLYKMGLVRGDMGKAMDNLTGIGGTACLSLIADYSVKAGPGKLYLTAALNQIGKPELDSDNKPKDTDAATYTKGYNDTNFGNDGSNIRFNNAIGFRVAYQMNKVITADLVARFFNSEVMGFGLYVSPTMVKGLVATVGFTYLLDNTVVNNEKTNKYSGLGIDARFRYEIIKGLTVTNHFNFTTMLETAKKTNGGIFDSLMVLYKLNDKIWLDLDFQIDADVKAENKTSTTSKMYITPNVVLIAGDGCQITTGVQFAMKTDKNFNADGSAKGDPTKTKSLAIPVIMRVKF